MHGCVCVCGVCVCVCVCVHVCVGMCVCVREQRRSDRVNGVNNYDHVRLENVQKSISSLYPATLLYMIVQIDLSSPKLLIDTLYPTCTPVGE